MSASREYGTPVERFMAHVEYDPNGGCWLWSGTVIKSTGYGQIQIAGHAESTHRLSWRLFRGADPGNLLVCHRCDVRCCVNPGHLFLGTHQDNLDDMVAKGRSSHGERNPRSKLTECDVAELFRLRAEGWSQPKLATRFGVSQPKVSQILLGKSWRRAPRIDGAVQAPIEKVVHAGESHHAAKLTADQVRSIRAMAGTSSNAAIGRLFGISRPTAAKIIARQIWTHIGDTPSATPGRAAAGAGGR